MNNRKQKLIATLLFAWLFVIAVISIQALTPPAARPADAPPETFSSVRAMEHVRVIAREPHPIGSPANEAVRAYLVKELEKLGLEPHIQEATGVVARFSAAGRVYNVAARLEGADPGRGKAILLVGHYDSVPSAPGANDDGSAVATLLETARALQAGPPLKNDVIFLFTDGEEAGLLGAEAFAREHPWRDEVGLVLNFEARGHTGPVYTFETSPDNAWLIPGLARALPYPVANSLMYEIYQLLPNDTDFTVFKQGGYSGFNFGYIGGLTHYHTPLDNVDNVDLRSLQHHGYYALGLARYFGDVDLTRPVRSQLIYFDVLGRILLYYPASWISALMLFSTLAYIGVLAFAIRKERATLKAAGAGALAFFLSLLLIGLATWAGWWLLTRIYPHYAWSPDIYNSSMYWAAFLALSTGLAALWYSRLFRKHAVESLALGALAWWLVLALVSSLFLAGGSFVFVFPLLSSLTGLALLLALPKKPGSSWRDASILALSALPGLLLVVPFIYGFHAAMSIQMLLAPALLLGLLLGTLLPHLQLILRPSRMALPLTAGIIFLGFLLAGSLTADFSATRPKQNMIVYGLDAGRGEALWMSTEQDEWSSQFLGSETRQDEPRQFFPAMTGQMPVHPAKVVSMPAPLLRLLDDRLSGDVRTLRFQVSSPRRASGIHLYATEDMQVLSATVAGQRMDPKEDRRPIEGYWRLDLWDPPQEGFEVTLEAAISGQAGVQILVVDHSWGLTDLPGVTYSPPPAYIMGSASKYNDSVLVSQTYHFGE